LSELSRQFPCSEGVNQKKWLSNIIDLEDKLFKNIKMKGFLIEEKEKAITFLKQQ
jgi:hypothetical protein